MPENKKCWNCKFYTVIDGGDWVDYGSTRVQTPEYYGCKNEHDINDNGDEIDIDETGCEFFEEEVKRE